MSRPKAKRLASQFELGFQDRPILRRAWTNPDIRPLNAEETVNIERSRQLVHQLKEMTEGDLDKYVVTISEFGVTKTRVRTRRSRDKALAKTLAALETLPAERTPSLELDFTEVTQRLAQLTTDREIQLRLQTIAEGRSSLLPGQTLDAAIEHTLLTNQVAELLAFESSCWKPEHFTRLLFEGEAIRPRAWSFSRHLLAAWLDQGQVETCLREDGPAPLLLKCWLNRLGSWQPVFEPTASPDNPNAQAAHLFRQCASAIANLPSRLLRLLRYLQHLPNMTPQIVLTFLCLRHYLPLADRCGFSRKCGKQFLHFALSPSNELQACHHDTLRVLLRSGGLRQRRSEDSEGATEGDSTEDSSIQTSEVPSAS